MSSPAFWDRAARKYAAKPVADVPSYEAKLAKVGGLLKPTDHLLEVGCGTGTTALKLAPLVAHVTATDVSSTMIEIARDKLGGDAPDNVEFIRAEVEATVASGPFDVVCAFNLLHLVDDLAVALQRLHAQVKPGGLFLSKTGCTKDGGFWMPPMIRVLTWVGYAPPVLALRRADLVAAVKDAGFDIEEVTHFGKQQMSPFIVARRAGN